MRGGIDELLSARHGFEEKSVCLDMIDEMLTVPENSQPTAMCRMPNF